MQRKETIRGVVITLAAMAGIRAAARADVIVVAQDGSGDWPQINQAIVHASDGDTILVRSGDYAPFIVPNVALEIVADEDATVTVHGYAAVTGLAANKVVLISGLSAVAQIPVHYGLYLADNQGAVRVRNCAFTGYSPPEVGCIDFEPLEPGGEAVHVEDSADVALVGCTAVGGNGQDSDSQYCLDTGGPGGHGLRATSSRVALYDCEVLGGEGGSSGYSGGGGAGVHLVASELFGSGERFRGGDAGDTWDSIWICGDGGAGLYVDATSTAHILDVALEGGAKGYPNGCGQNGPPSGGSGSLTVLSGTARSLDAPRVAREDTVAQVTLHGVPGDAAILCRSSATDYQFRPFLRGVLLLQSPLAHSLLVPGTIGSDGTLTLSLPIPLLPPGVESTVLHLQGLFDGALDGKLLGSAAQLVVVDSVH